jgi:guanosine-3',5'-bis(diphosphate) 3'-pyrophosphohydrolase
VSDHIAIEDISIIWKALQFAARKHKDQRRKDAQASPYINHPIAVAGILWEVGGIRDIDVIVAALLHNTIEDTDTTPEELEAEFGMEICSIVREVTDDKSLPKQVRKQLQIEHSGSLSLQARQLKLADKICNIRDQAESPPASWSLERRIKYI